MDILALQIAHALFRIGSYIKQKDIRARIEAHSVYLLESASSFDMEGVERAIVILEKLILLGEEIGEIHYQHAQILHGQFANLRSSLKNDKESSKMELAISDIFNGNYEKYMKNNSLASLSASNLIKPAAANAAKLSINRQDPAISNSTITDKIVDDEPKRLWKQTKENKSGNSPLDGNWSVERQELIAQKVGELGKAAMKDLIAAFPEVSERTLRYDLRKLNNRQIIERIGNGGPASYYVIKNSVFAGDLRMQ